MCASLRRTVSHVPSPEFSDGMEETAKITPAQTSTGNQREAREQPWWVERRNGRRGREPGESRGRSRRCERRCPSPPRHWPASREGGDGGSLESEDLPVAPHTEPLAEGGFVAKGLVVVLITVLVLPASALAASVKVRIEGK